MIFPFQAKIWLYQTPVDFRKQIDGLMVLVADHLKANPTNGDLYIFRNRHKDKLKLLWWESNGFWLMYKRLEEGRLKFPREVDGRLELSSEQLQWLLSGLDIAAQPARKVITATNFY